MSLSATIPEVVIIDDYFSKSKTTRGVSRAAGWETLVSWGAKIDGVHSKLSKIYSLGGTWLRNVSSRSQERSEWLHREHNLDSPVASTVTVAIRSIRRSRVTGPPNVTDVTEILGKCRNHLGSGKNLKKKPKNSKKILCSLFRAGYFYLVKICEGGIQAIFILIMWGILETSPLHPCASCRKVKYYKH